MIAFIDDHRGAYGVEPICRVLRIAPSTYHTRAAQRADPARACLRARQDLVLMAQIRQVHGKRSDEARLPGTPPVTAAYRRGAEPAF